MDRVDNVHWLFGMEGLGKAMRDLVADRVCGLEEIELDHQQVRRPELLPEEHHIQPRLEAAAEGAVHRGATGARVHSPSGPLVVRDLREVLSAWRTLTVVGEAVVACPEIQVDCKFMERLGREGANLRASCDRHGVHGEDGHPGLTRGRSTSLSTAFLEFLGEIGRKRIVIRSDDEPAVKALVQAVALHRAGRDDD